MVTYEDILKANEAIRTTTIEKTNKRTGEVSENEYAQVNQRIKAFRMVYPNGFIITSMDSNENGVCVFTASCGYYGENGDPFTIGTGTAYEKEGSSFINQTSYIENCETSAVGRALGMAGFGVDTSVASAEEVQNAMMNQTAKQDEKPKTATPKQIEVLLGAYKDDNLAKLLAANNISRIEDLPMSKASELIGKLRERGKQNG